MHAEACTKVNLPKSACSAAKLDLVAVEMSITKITK